MKTKALNSEIVYQLSARSNITETIKQFSVTSKTTDIALIGVDILDAALFDVVMPAPGNIIDIKQDLVFTEEKLGSIVKSFNLTVEELSVSSVKDAVMTKIAVKDI